MTSSLVRAACTVVDGPDVRSNPQVPRATLSDVTDAVLKILRPDLQRRSRQLVVEVTETSCFLEGDPSPVAQVMADLLDCVSRRALTNPVMVRVAVERDQVVIQAREAGRGIDLPLARQLTETYGLAISCSVVEEAADGGSEIEVRVRVPVAESAADGPEHEYDWEAQMLLALAVSGRPQTPLWRA
ncbi:MAG TPA: hypothetical protein VGU74_10535 [Gemmatimonadales bacterium]|nr:hypothetical protein [Gemmatimonadales bacterium]